MSDQPKDTNKETPEQHWKRFEATTRQLFSTPKPAKPAETKEEKK